MPRPPNPMCPTCGIRPKYVTRSGLRASYCTPCSTLRRLKNNPSGPCAACGVNERATFNGRRVTYCAVCRKSQALDRHKTDPRKKMLHNAKLRAKEDQLPFDLQLDDILIPTTCPVLGTTLSVGIGAPTPNSPSLDKVVPALGYVRGNVVVMSHRANSIKHDATVDELERLVAFLKTRTTKKDSVR